jgi:hypothetical protein
MAYGPCLNPSCRSHGQPHPHCKCYGPGMAEGGSVEGFCASNNPHKASCEYYKMAEGGEVHPTSTDPSVDVVGAIAHGGAGMLFGNRKSPYQSAFGAPSTAAKLAELKDGPEAARMQDWQAKVAKGHKAIKKGVGSLFEHGSPDTQEVGEKDIDTIRDYVKNGGPLAELQEGKPGDPLAAALPQHNLLANASKSKAYGYLLEKQPKPLPKLPFDKESMTTNQEREYKRALGLAAAPLNVLKEIKDGSLTPQHVAHIMGMYPELGNYLAKKMTEGVTKAQIEGRRVPYGTRQAMSLFMGSALDSTMTPQSIMAAQAVFADQRAQQAAAGQGAPPKKTKKKLDNAVADMSTANQAAQRRQQESK